MYAIKENTNGIVMCVFEIIVGILLLIAPEQFTEGVIVVLGIMLALMSLVNIIKYFREDALTAAVGQKLFTGLICLFVAVLCFAGFRTIAGSERITIIYGIIILVMGLSKVQWTVDMLRLKKKKWYLSAISAAISFLCAAIIILNPDASTNFIWIFAGVSLVIESVFDLVSLVIKARIEPAEDIEELEQED